MQVTVCSRDAAEALISSGRFPQNTAVISFCDPPDRHGGEAYAPVDYSAVCGDVCYCELEDLDRDYLPERGYTYESFFPDAARLAAFVYAVHGAGMDLICQCDYGQSRSAGCAAAVLEHFAQRGISIFAGFDYYPNQVVYHKMMDALAAYKRHTENGIFFGADAARMTLLPEELLRNYDPADADSVADTRLAAVQYLEAQGMLHRSLYGIMGCFLSGTRSLTAALRVEFPRGLYLPGKWDPAAVFTRTRYAGEKITVTYWFDRIRFRDSRASLMRRHPRRSSAYRLDTMPIRSFDFLGKLTWDSARKMIDAVPWMITNLKYM